MLHPVYSGSLQEETICINCQSLFSGNNKKNSLDLSSAEFAHKVVNARHHNETKTYLSTAYFKAYDTILLKAQTHSCLKEILWPTFAA